MYYVNIFVPYEPVRTIPDLVRCLTQTCGTAVKPRCLEFKINGYNKRFFTPNLELRPNYSVVGHFVLLEVQE